MTEGREGIVTLLNDEFNIMLSSLLIENEVFLASYAQPVKQL